MLKMPNIGCEELKIETNGLRSLDLQHLAAVVTVALLALIVCEHQKILRASKMSDFER